MGSEKENILQTTQIYHCNNPGLDLKTRKIPQEIAGNRERGQPK
jgi:hypothetical protein